MPVIGGGDTASTSSEPGGSTCYKCDVDIQPGDSVYREVFGEVNQTTDHGVVYDATGGVLIRHFCQSCYREHRMRDAAAHYAAEDTERLYAILEASDGRLVADTRQFTIGGRGWVRVTADGIEARHSVRVRGGEDDDWDIGFDTEPTPDFDHDRFDELFSDLPDGRGVLLRPVDETPFADDDGGSAGG